MAYRTVPPTAALEEMLRRDQEAGVDVFDHGDSSPQPPGPPEQVEPLLPVAFPAPDWRAEERERARRQPVDGEDQPESQASLDSAPARKQKKPKRTPLLDEVRSWRIGT
jgi:hypothetical protein